MSADKVQNHYVGLLYQELRRHSMLAHARTYLALPFFACEEADNIGAKVYSLALMLVVLP